MNSSSPMCSLWSQPTTDWSWTIKQAFPFYTIFVSSVLPKWKWPTLTFWLAERRVARYQVEVSTNDNSHLCDHIVTAMSDTLTCTSFFFSYSKISWLDSDVQVKLRLTFCFTYFCSTLLGFISLKCEAVLSSVPLFPACGKPQILDWTASHSAGR